VSTFRPYRYCHVTNLECTSDEIVGGIFKEPTPKLANTGINEFLNTKSERDLKMLGKVVNGIGQR